MCTSARRKTVAKHCIWTNAAKWSAALPPGSDLLDAGDVHRRVLHAPAPADGEECPGNNNAPQFAYPVCVKEQRLKPSFRTLTQPQQRAEHGLGEQRMLKKRNANELIRRTFHAVMHILVCGRRTGPRGRRLFARRACGCRPPPAVPGTRSTAR